MMISTYRRVTIIYKSTQKHTPRRHPISTLFTILLRMETNSATRNVTIKGPVGQFKDALEIQLNRYESPLPPRPSLHPIYI